MRVTDGLWAVGDIATFPLNGQPQRIEHWRLAQQQARIAAANMLGGDERYLDVPYFWTWHFGKNYDYLGHAEAWDEVEFKGDPVPSTVYRPVRQERRGGGRRCLRSGTGHGDAR